MTRTVLTIVLALAVSGGSSAANVPESETDLVGVYRCQGMNPDGSSYEGIVEIARIDSTFRVRWMLSNDVNLVGVGIYSSGVLAVSYFGGAPGVVVYKLEANRLIGEWTMGGAEGTIYTETLTKVPSEQRRPERRAPAAGHRTIAAAR
jgi:hypothetical protein